jgi:hypothetical protein
MGYRDKKVVGVFVLRFRAQLINNSNFIPSSGLKPIVGSTEKHCILVS